MSLYLKIIWKQLIEAAIYRLIVKIYNLNI